MIVYKNIEEAFSFYNIDNKYKKKCYECAEEINNSDKYTEAFNKVYKILYYNDFSDIRKLWDIRNINELFTDNVNPFITNIMILLGYEFHLYNIKKYNLDDKQISIIKKELKNVLKMI